MCENQTWKLLSFFGKLSHFHKLLEIFGLNISNNSIFVTFPIYFKNNLFWTKIPFLFIYLHYLDRLFLQYNKNDIFIKIISNFDGG